ncbi:MAG: T9SS type A sorting domain-containing protein [Ferruginibacter sp.]
MQRTITQKIYCFFHPRILALVFLMATGLFSNAQYVNGILSTGATAANGTAAPAGYTWSECQNPTGNLTVANSTGGNSASSAGLFSIADDFTVPTGQTWNVTKVTVYGYLTGATGATSPITTLHVRIHNSNPASGPTTIVFGDLTTNRLTAASDAGVYRIFNTLVPATATGTTRKIWKLEAAITVSLTAGTYWLEYQDETGFMPLSSPVGVRTIAGYNAIQGSNNGATYAAMTDAGVTNTGVSANLPVAVDMPFIIDYTTAACTAPALPTATATPSTVSSGNPSTLAVTAGALNSATAWKWYSGSCGGTLVGTGTSIVVNPTVTTTYYVRAEGGCVTPGACTAVTVNVSGSCISPASATICAGVIQPISTVGGLTAVWSPVTGLYSDAGATIPYVAGTPAITVYAKPTTTTTYTATYSSGPCAASTNTIVVTVNPIPTIAVTPTTGCGPLALTASGGTTYSWSPAAGLSATTGATVTASPTVNTVYTVTGTTAGCSNTATANVTYTPAAPTVFPASPVSACLGTPQPLSITTAAGFGAPVSVSFPSGPLSLAIPENVSGISNTVTVSGIPTGAVITAASVTLNITHTYVGDCMISLKAPNTNILNLDNLLSGTNNPGANFVNTVIGSTGVTLLSAGIAPGFTGLFKPDGNTAATGAFGVPSGATGFAPNTPTYAGLYSIPNGPWTIAIYDAGPPDVGTLTSWTLNLTYTPIVPYTGTWTPSAGLFTDAAGLVPYTGTSVSTVYAKPPASTTYSVTIANGACASPATSVAVTVNTPVAITVQPVSTAVCTDKTTSFSVTATGTNPVHNWQVSTNGGTSYSNLANNANYAGANTATLIITAPPVSWNGFRYRDSIGGSSPCGSAVSTAAVLTVNPLPTITLTASPYTRLYPGLKTTITAAVSPVAAATYTWFLNGIQIPGATIGTYIADIDHLGDYTLKVTDVNGCTSTSGVKTIADSVSTNLFVYPNPNSGTFQVRYYSLPGNALVRNVFIYDDKGSRIYAQAFSIGRPYGSISVDLTRYRSGTYWVELADANGKRLKFAKVVVL